MVAPVVALRTSTRAAFAPTIPWESRKWLRWERLLYTATQTPMVALAVLAIVAPLTLAALPVLPLVSLVLLRAPPTPRGLYEVGVAEVQPKLRLRGPGIREDERIRLRVFYPAEAAAPRRRRWLPMFGFAARGARSWLPRGDAAQRYAEAHVNALPFVPKRALPFFRRYLGWVLHFARLPERVTWGARAAAAPHASGTWPLTLFSHGLYGCAISYGACCAELASHGSVVVALEHKDGSSIYSETDDGAKMAYGDTGKESNERIVHRVAEVRALIRQIGEIEHEIEREIEIGNEIMAEGGARRGLPLAKDAVTLVGHSFGASTVLSAAASLETLEKARSTQRSRGDVVASGTNDVASGLETDETAASFADGTVGDTKPSGGETAGAMSGVAVGAVVALDPWISGYNVSEEGVAAVPTIALLTPSMMYPQNAEQLTEVLGCVAQAREARQAGGGKRSQPSLLAKRRFREVVGDIWESGPSTPPHQ